MMILKEPRTVFENRQKWTYFVKGFVPSKELNEFMKDEIEIEYGVVL